MVADRAGTAGFRLAHQWLDPGRCLYDALGDGFALVVTAGSGAPALEAAARDRAVPVHVLDVRHRDLRHRISHDLLLVRPDQHVKWTGDTPVQAPADAVALIDQVRGATPQTTPTAAGMTASVPDGSGIGTAPGQG